MKIVILAVRVVVGALFVVFGLNHFFHFMQTPSPELTPAGVHFMTAIAPSGYLDAVKVLEVAGGVFLLSGVLVPLGLVLLTPIIVNIAFFDVFLMGKPGLGVILLPVAVFLIWAYRPYFAGAFTVLAQPAKCDCLGASACSREPTAETESRVSARI
jgi:uncharacterized membrane protein YphA (DoxX/SURF4 family)